MIKAIETHYRGFRFRSRAEARWAVFFEAAGIRFEYEPEGYVINGRPYLTDFWLPDARMWLEVKRGEVTEEEKGLCKGLAVETGYRCLLANGPPRPDGGITAYCEHRECASSCWPGDCHIADDRRNAGVFWLVSPGSGASRIILTDNMTAHDRYPEVCTATARGYAASLAARFEHGQSGPGP
jgi:hypothetical protein